MIVGIGPSCPLADIHVTLSLVSASIFRHLRLNTFGSRLAVVAVPLESFKRWQIQLTGELPGSLKGFGVEKAER